MTKMRMNSATSSLIGWCKGQSDETKILWDVVREGMSVEELAEELDFRNRNTQVLNIDHDHGVYKYNIEKIRSEINWYAVADFMLNGNEPERDWRKKVKEKWGYSEFETWAMAKALKEDVLDNMLLVEEALEAVEAMPDDPTDDDAVIAASTVGDLAMYRLIDKAEEAVMPGLEDSFYCRMLRTALTIPSEYDIGLPYVKEAFKQLRGGDIESLRKGTILDEINRELEETDDEDL